MNRMKYLMGATLLVAALCSCQPQQTPKTLAREFVQQLYALDFDGATKLTASGGQALLADSRRALEAQGSIEEERGRRNAQAADDVFDTETFTESGSGDELTVQNNQLRINMRKEGDGWKVAATPELVDALVNHPGYVQAAVTAWNNLQGEYDKRTKLVQEYVTLRSNRGDASPELHALESAVRECAAASAGTAADRADYVACQDRLDGLLDKGVSPAMNASSDFTLNYIVQLSDARTRLQDLRRKYGTAAAKAHVRDYPELP